MVWVVSRIRFKVETSLTRSHTSINSWLNPRQRSPRWRGPHHETEPAHQLIEYPSTLIADYGREKKIPEVRKYGDFELRPIRKPLTITGPGPVIDNGSSYRGQLRICLPTFVPEERSRASLRNALFRSKYYRMDKVQKPVLLRCLLADFCVMCV